VVPAFEVWSVELVLVCATATMELANSDVARIKALVEREKKFIFENLQITSKTWPDANIGCVNL